MKDIPKIKGLTPKEFRTIAQSIHSMQFRTKETLLKVLQENSQEDSKFLFNAFLESNLIKENAEGYEPTILLSAIAGISFAKRKSSEDAWLEVAKIIARTVVLSSSIDWSIQSPSNLYIFGSMLDPNKKDHGDADLSLTTNVIEDYNMLQKIQKEWLNNYYPFISKRFDNSYFFADIYQLKSDIKSSSNFPSIHDTNDIIGLSELNTNFPIMNLWENELFKLSKKNDNEKRCEELCLDWKKNNPQQYQIAQDKLKIALRKIGISSTNKQEYIIQCENYVKNTLKADIIRKIKNKLSDTVATNRAVRFCRVGFDAIDESIEELSNENIESTQLEFFIFNSKDMQKTNKKIKY